VHRASRDARESKDPGPAGSGDEPEREFSPQISSAPVPGENTPRARRLRKHTRGLICAGFLLKSVTPSGDRSFTNDPAESRACPEPAEGAPAAPAPSKEPAGSSLLESRLPGPGVKIPFRGRESPQTDPGSFDSAKRFVTESLRSAQDDNVLGASDIGVFRAFARADPPPQPPSKSTDKLPPRKCL
jgi:hypothetical protein